MGCMFLELMSISSHMTNSACICPVLGNLVPCLLWYLNFTQVQESS